MQKNKNSFAHTVKTRWQLWVLAGPFLVLFFLMTVLPVISSMVLSFTSFDMVSFPSFTGFNNYIRMFLHDDIFPIVFKNTVLLAILTGPAGFILSFVLAWFINEFKPFARTIFSFMFYAPSLAGGVFIWQIAFSSDAYGYVNSLLLSFGIIQEPVAWLSSSVCRDWEFRFLLTFRDSKMLIRSFTRQAHWTAYATAGKSFGI